MIIDYKNKLVFVSSPYSSDNSELKDLRFKHACIACGHIMNNNAFPISPIVHGIPIARECSVPDSFKFWHEYCMKFVLKSDIIFVLNMDGWMDSIGVTDEMLMGRTSRKDIYLVDYIDSINIIKKL